MAGNASNMERIYVLHRYKVNGWLSYLLIGLAVILSRTVGHHQDQIGPEHIRYFHHPDANGMQKREKQTRTYVAAYRIVVPGLMTEIKKSFPATKHKRYRYNISQLTKQARIHSQVIYINQLPSRDLHVIVTAKYTSLLQFLPKLLSIPGSLPTRPVLLEPRDNSPRSRSIHRLRGPGYSRLESSSHRRRFFWISRAPDTDCTQGLYTNRQNNNERNKRSTTGANHKPITRVEKRTVANSTGNGSYRTKRGIVNEHSDATKHTIEETVLRELRRVLQTYRILCQSRKVLAKRIGEPSGESGDTKRGSSNTRQARVIHTTRVLRSGVTSDGHNNHSIYSGPNISKKTSTTGPESEPKIHCRSVERGTACDRGSCWGLGTTRGPIALHGDRSGSTYTSNQIDENLEGRTTQYCTTNRRPTPTRRDIKASHYWKMGGRGSGRTSIRTLSQGGRGGKKNLSQRELQFGNGKETSGTKEGNTQHLAKDASNNDDPPSNEEKATDIGIIDGLTVGTNPSKAPIEKPIVSKPEEPKEIMETTYKIKLNYRNKVEGDKVDAVTKMRSLMARLFQYEPSILMLPFDPTNKSNHITTAKDIPTNLQDFEIYVPVSSVLPKSNVLRMSFRISSNKPLWKIKMNTQIRQFLAKYDIYLDQTYLSTTDNVKVGGIVLSHNQFTRRDAAIKDLNIRINKGEADKTHIQLCPYTIWNGQGEEKISTKLLAVECSREHINEVKSRLFKKLLTIPTEMKHSNTRHYKFLPFHPTGAITTQMIRSGIYLQNRFLIQATVITLIHVNNLTWKVPNAGETSFQAYVLEAKNKEGKALLFTTVEMGASDNKVHLVTTQHQLEEATQWVVEFESDMLNVSSDSKFWEGVTGAKIPPVRINKLSNSDEHSDYANLLQNTFQAYNGKESSNTMIRNAPKGQTWSRVVYGTITGSGTEHSRSNNTQETEVSTITTKETSVELGRLEKKLEEKLDGVQKKTNEEVKKSNNSLLEEMRQLNEQSVLRMQRIESKTNDYDALIRELHANNRAKADEMMQYEKRLQQISNNTTETVCKVDKLNVTMKKFIEVMVNILGPKQQPTQGCEDERQGLMELVNFLAEDQDNVSMDASVQNKKHKPSPDGDSVLGGEGSRE